MLKYMKDYYQNNREKRLESLRKYRQNNKEKIKESMRKYRLRMKNEKQIGQNDSLKLDNEGCSFVTHQIDDLNNKSVDLIFSEKNGQINNEGNYIGEGTSFDNQQNRDCVKSRYESTTYPYGERTCQEADVHSIKQVDDQNDLIDLSFLDDPDFLKNLTS
ncbi:unnamed protein product [Meloidogyne enterolobii]